MWFSYSIALGQGIYFLWSICKPHSLSESCSHHQRPARRSSPGFMALVQGSQPMLGYPLSCNLLYGTSFFFMYSQTFSQLQSASGFNFTILLCPESISTFFATALVAT